MRIILFVDTFPSLSETFISNKVRYLAEKGCNVFVFCVKRNNDLLHELFGNNKNVEVVLLRKSTMVPFLLSHPFLVTRFLFKPTSLRQRLFRRFRLAKINQYKPDIIHFEFSGIGVDYLYEIRKVTCKKVVSCRGSAEKVKLLIHKDRKENFRALLDEVDAVHCVSEDMRRTILPYCNKPEKIFINYPSINTAFFSKQHLSQKKTDIVTILSVGRFTFQKGFGTGLQAIHLLKESGVDFKWMIVGSGPEYEQILYQVHHFKLQDHVQLLGARSSAEVKDLMVQADIYFLPSVYEGIANVALEAMSMELPVVATRSGGMEEVIVPAENGLLADVYDHIGLADHLLLLLKDAGLRKQLGSNARKTIEQRFTLDIQTEKYIAVYSKLAGITCIQPAQDTIEQLNAPADKVTVSAIPSTPYKKQLHIGIILPEFPTVSETFFINKVIGLCNRGHRVTVFGGRKPIDNSVARLYRLDNYKNLVIADLDFKSSLLHLGKIFFLFPSAFFKSFHTDLQVFRRKLYVNLCKAYTNKYNCDIYHFGYSGIAIFYLSLFDSLKGKTVISCRGTAENVKLISEKERIKKLKILFEKVDKIHCVSASMSNTVQSYGAPVDKIFINRPAIDTTFFSRQNQVHHNDKIIILSVGRLVFQKGFMIGLLAIQKLKEQFGNFVWKIAGDGPKMEELMTHIHSLGLMENIVLLGKKDRNEIKELYEEADIYFLPSVSEGLANAVLEAMSMSLAVVSSDVGGMQEAITHNADGKLVSNYDHAAMAAQLLELCKDDVLRKKLGEAARKTAEEKFDISRYIDVFEDEYYKLLH
ncbi:glycosyltransferase family 4 protein [Panacibacter ginsenosidivorans]|uniref:Glycosyltransferase family 4 protein n=1 Tax=Panacibacter ginsenosidivorans TaxID=1813871 RepID=A0A5B8VDG3_9BACT|nr:glycosyltransferase family 4 protein [Panacibacter ginsenosidivorans]QEC69095.1 glycosyltransferase family 4 protein [Panacibacter ginsenosidivorans]